VGAFYQPKLVVIDPLTLGSLPEREIRCGMSEVIKYGAIRSADLFRRLGTRPAIEEFPDIIRACCRVKSEIVARDELDAGERMILNFGHTFGHAVERYYDFERYNHGEAVAVGMVAEASVGEEMGITARGAADALADLLALYGLDADCRDVLCAGGISDTLPHLLRSDKKSRGNGLDMVFLHEIGDARARYVDFAEIEHAFERYKGRRNN
jgi:3-dehydroquinate synthase